MCRWMVYSGNPLPAEVLLFEPEHSIVEQSLHSRLGATTSNGDGFGVGWYGEGPEPAVFKSVSPAWNDANLREISRQVRASLLFAHVRASTGTAVQRSNCHPFRWGRWLWMHNGHIAGFDVLKRDLLFEVDPGLFPSIEGATDSEALFYLALTHGLAEDPVGAVERAVGRVEQLAAQRGVPEPVQMTVATSDGETVWAFRYSTEGRSRSLFLSTPISELRGSHAGLSILSVAGDEGRLVVSEPLRDLPGLWHEVPESSVEIIQHGRNVSVPFRPRR